MSADGIHHYSAGAAHAGLDLYVNDLGELVLFCAADGATWTLPSATPAPAGHGGGGVRGGQDRRVGGDATEGIVSPPAGGPAWRPPSLVDDLRAAGIVDAQDR